jgi:hypothetical protein
MLDEDTTAEEPAEDPTAAARAAIIAAMDGTTLDEAEAAEADGDEA